MSTTVVVVKDHTQSLAMTLIYGQVQKQTIEARFEQDDALLARLQTNPLFKGVVRLGQLEPQHYRALLSLHLALVADLSPEKRRLATHPLMRSLDILLIGLLICLERRIQGSVSMMTLNRAGDTVLYEISASLDEFELPTKPKPSGGLRVIVDNA
jgi:hypothetical protein